MTSLVHSIRRRTLVVGLTVASFVVASGSAYAAPAVVQLGDGPASAKTRTVARIPTRPEEGRRADCRSLRRPYWRLAFGRPVALS